MHSFLLGAREFLILQVFLLVVLGLWIRNGLEDTPDFQKAKDEGTVSKMPIVDTFKNHWKEVILNIWCKSH
jgi:hypothetical protein